MVIGCTVGGQIDSPVPLVADVACSVTIKFVVKMRDETDEQIVIDIKTVNNIFTVNQHEIYGE